MMCVHAAARAAAVAFANLRPGSPPPLSPAANSLRTRNIVVSDAPPPGPKTSTCEVWASMSLKILMPLAGRSRVGESRCHIGYTGHFSLTGTYSRLSTSHPQPGSTRRRSTPAPGHGPG